MVTEVLLAAETNPSKNLSYPTKFNLMLSITDLKKNTIIKLDGQPWKVIDYAQKQMGRGGSIVNVKIKNLLDGRVVPKTFKGQDSIEPADVQVQNTKFLYSDSDKAFFMDDESFEQYEVDADSVESELMLLKEGQAVGVQLFDGNPVNLEMPKNLFLKVTEAPEIVKGDTSSALTKEITLETGLKIKAPAFIKPGDEISIDTSTLEYRERKK